jgi:hypothetical protein
LAAARLLEAAAVVATAASIKMKEVNKSPSNEDVTKDPKNKLDKEAAALASSKPSITNLLTLMNASEKLMIIVSFNLVFGSEAANLLTPLIVANAYNVLVEPSTSEDEERKMFSINHYMILAIIVTIAGIISDFFWVTIQSVVGERVVARLRCRLYSRILKQGEL